MEQMLHAQILKDQLRHFDINPQDKTTILKGVIFPDEVVKSKRVVHTVRTSWDYAHNIMVSGGTFNTGMAIHYFQDYFCKYHNGWKFYWLIGHYFYEKHLTEKYFKIGKSAKFRSMVESLMVDLTRVDFESALEDMYNEYMAKEPSAELDLAYASAITRMALIIGRW
jgi:hypothetical protein